MSRPDVKITLSNGNLGRTAPSEDGTSGLIVSGVAVAGKFALGDILGPFTSVADAEAKGITEAYDTNNTCLAFKHISDFYNRAGNGTKLYVMVVAKTVFMADMANKTMDYAKKMLATAQGDIKLLSISRVPDGAYVPAYTDQFENDMWTAIINLKALHAEEFNLHRPVRFYIEGRNWQGDPATTKDLRNAGASPNANMVQVVIGHDQVFAAANAHATKYASVGDAMGKDAGNPVQRNKGRVKDGELGLLKVGFSDGTEIINLTDSEITLLNDKGYVFFLSHAQKSGFFYNDSHMACVLTDDYAQMELGRVMDKAARITRRVYVDELLDEIDVDPATGKLAVSTIKHFQGIVETAINAEMTAKGEIVSVTTVVDPNQNVLATSKIVIQENIVPKGIARTIEATLAYDNPSINA